MEFLIAMGDHSAVKVRPATIADLDRLVEFNAALAKETEGRLLDLTQLRLGVKALIRDGSKGWYVVAEHGVPSGSLTVIGQLLVTFEWSDWRNGNFWWIQSLYVHPDFRRQGILRALYTYLQAQAQSSQELICGFRLYVEQQNHDAHGAYAHLGFQKTAYHMYEKE